MKYLTALLAALAVTYVKADEEEKERYIYGKPSDDDYGVSRSPDDVIRLEKMWDLDLNMQKTRGFIQGYHRGMYKDFDYLIPEKCLGKDSTLQLYWLNNYSKSGDFANFGPSMGLVYNMYFNVDIECEVDKYLFDMSCFCFDHDCGW